MGRVTKRELTEAVEEYLSLRPVVSRSKELEKAIKQNMEKTGHHSIEVEAGRVFISVSDQMTISPETARDVLGAELAARVIQTREFVSNDLVDALSDTGFISMAEVNGLVEQAKSKQVIRLYVRPAE